MKGHHVRRVRLLTAVSVLGLAGGVIAMTAAPAGASARHGGRVPVHSAAAVRGNPLAHIPAPRAGVAASFQAINYNSGLCLGITGGRDNAPALQWSCNGNPDQSWHWGSQNGSHAGWFQLVNGDGECLGVTGGSLSQGARVVGWSCNGNADQYWASIGASCSGYVPVENLNSGQVLGVAGNSTANGAAVVQWGYQGVCNNQFWFGL